MDTSAIHLPHVPALQIAGTVCFALAVLHTFAAKPIAAFRHRFAEGSGLNNLFHYLGEVEVVFGFWAFLFLLLASGVVGLTPSVAYLDTVSYAEPVFVFCIMCIASTEPILAATRSIISLVGKALTKATSIPTNLTEFFSILTIGPVLGSFITEPAAMTVSAILVKDFLDARGASSKFKYAVLGLLFVNISIGGVFTTYAAPPVIMVASKFGWDNLFMAQNFGIKAAISILLCTLVTTILFHKDIALRPESATDTKRKMPLWMILSHIAFMALIVVYHKHIPFFLGLFLLFLGFTEVTQEHQSPLKLRESLLVGFFLAGLVTLGNMQAWWLQDAIAKMDNFVLFTGTTLLTAVTDNAALTYLGGLVPTLSETAKYMLVAGAVVGGGLTVIANAPNPAGYGILRSSFGEDGISPLYLFLGAVPPTVVAFLLFGFA